MKTSELIKMIQDKDPSGNLPIEVAVGSYTAVYPHAYLTNICPENGPECLRLYVRFPKGFIVSERKQKD